MDFFRIAAGGEVSTLPCTLGSQGSIGNVTLAQMGCLPKGIALDSQGNLYITNLYPDSPSVLQVTPAGNLSFVPVIGMLDVDQNGIAILGNTIYLAYAWGIWTITL